MTDKQQSDSAQVEPVSIPDELAAIADLDAQIAALTAQKNDHRARVFAELVATGQTYDDGQTLAYVRAAGERPGYKTRKIDNEVLPVLLPLAVDLENFVTLAEADFRAEFVTTVPEGEGAAEVLAKIGARPDGLLQPVVDGTPLFQDTPYNDGTLIETTVRALTNQEIAAYVAPMSDQLSAAAAALAAARSVSRVAAGLTITASRKREEEGEDG